MNIKGKILHSAFNSREVAATSFPFVRHFVKSNSFVKLRGNSIRSAASGRIKRQIKLLLK